MPVESAAAAAADASMAAIERRARAVLQGLDRAIAALTSTAGDVVAPPPEVSSAHDLDVALASWRSLVPSDPEIRALLLRRVLDRYGLPVDDLPELASALGLGDDAVEAAFVTRYGEPSSAATARVAVRAPARHGAFGDVVGAERLFQLERCFTPMTLEAGEILFRAGDPGDSLYVVVAGRVDVLVGEPGAQRRVSEIEAGEIVGELSLLTGEARSATVTAVRDSQLYRLDAADVERHLLTEPLVVRSILATLARRVRKSSTGMVEGTGLVRSITLIPAGSTPAAEVVRFVARLAGVLASSYRVAVIDRGATDRRIGPSGLSGGTGELSHWLSEVEAAHDLVLYDAGAVSSSASAREWAELCVRQADLVLLVGLGEASPRRGPAEQVLAGRPASSPPKQLVLLHRPGRDPANSAAWRAGRELGHVYQVVADDRLQLGRLARSLLGCPVGLVLSGGGLRGFAHIGLARALEERGIPIDAVCGTSAGALIGGALAMGWSADEVERRSLRHFAGSRRRLLDYTVPVTSLLSGARLNHVLAGMFGDRQIEDLWLPFYATVTDLTTTELVVVGSGRLRDAVRASSSLPVLLPPVVSDGHLLADGGIVNNLPVLPLLEHMAIGKVVACNVAMPYYTADEPYSYRDSFPWWRVLNARLNPLAERLVAPSITKVLMRALEVGTKSIERAQAGRADVYVRPEFSGLSDFDLAQLPAFIGRGYEAASRALDQFDLAEVPFR